MQTKAVEFFTNFAKTQPLFLSSILFYTSFDTLSLLNFNLF
ncbi:hypothetical protein HD_1405 [[Haemophilus] ducreyi 35000HP]|uniref:Uncharacterized protein n=1 Tax=Haemophilus ducreyi (strain 35000HP / ATCC 700724) TaxID=233412 RepID=Q7VLM2_HAEDU|nr:hypothetical protein HD_1405 [[Haemophilus] ducreyi 35000HP]